MNRTPEQLRSIVEQLGPAEQLVNLIINFPDHLWHNRPGVIQNGKWRAAQRADIVAHRNGELANHLRFAPAGPNVDAIERAYRTLAEIYRANEELAARLASYVMLETNWRDMKVVCAAFMLVQHRSGQPVVDEHGGPNGQTREVLFHDDDYREIGEAMIKIYRRGSNRMMNPKLIRRVGQVLQLPAVAELNRELGFGHPAKRSPFTGRYQKAVRDWLRFREANPSLLEGLVKAGFGSTVRQLARSTGYKPQSQRFFEILGWRQSQAASGHRQIGLTGLNIERLSFDGLDEAAICAQIGAKNLGWKQVMGLLPQELGLTPAICVALLDSFSDKDLSILTPTLEELGLLKHEPIKQRWQAALATLDDQRTRNIAKNVRNRETAQALASAADAAVTRAVDESTKELDLRILFLIDVSGSMEGAIEQSVEALSMIVQGFAEEKVHIACFDTIGTVIVPRQWSAAGIAHALSKLTAGGGTQHSAAVAALHKAGVVIPDESELIVFVVGDEAGEQGATFAQRFVESGYRPAAFAHIVNIAQGWNRGLTVRQASEHLGVPYTEVNVEQFTDVYQVQRTLKAVLEAQPFRSRASLIEKILQVGLLQKPY